MNNNLFSKIFIAVTLVASLCFSSCKDNTVNTDNLLIWDFDMAVKNAQTIPLSRYAKDLRYIPLETSNSSLIGRIAQVENVDDKIFIRTTIPGKEEVIVFSPDGKYIKTLNKFGRGPGEYIRLCGMCIEEDNNNLVTLFSGNKLLSYDINSEKLVRETPLDTIAKIIGRYMVEVAKNATYMGNGKYFFEYKAPMEGSSEDDVASFCIIDTLGNIIKNNFAKKDNYHVGCKNIMKYDDNLIWSQVKNDTIYRITDNLELTPHCVITNVDIYKNRGKGRGSISMRTQLGTELFECDHFMTVGVNIEGMKGVFPDKIYKDGAKNAHTILLYDKTTKKSVLVFNRESIYKYGFTNDIDYGMPFYPRFYSKNKLYDYVSAASFIEFAEKMGCQPLKRIAATLNEESNPVLVEVTLR